MSHIRLIQTARDTNERLTEKDASCLAGKGGNAVTLSLVHQSTFQSITGFGGAFTEAAAYTFYRMHPKLQKEILEKYFDPILGLGYSIGRVHMNSCDFALGNYTYVEEFDTKLDTFGIAHEDKWTIPMIKEAEAVRKSGIKLLASPWSPPAWMKTNGDMNHGGQLRAEYREVWARYYAKYFHAMREKGLKIWATTVQNEPAAVQTWDSCIYSAEEEGAFVRDYLGPVLASEGLSDVKIYIWDHNRDIMVERACGALSDPAAAQYVYGIANHWYVSEAYENLSKVHELFPDKHILFTEGCCEGGLQAGSWLSGEKYGRNMIGDFNNWQEGWLDWNLILDETGGPNHVGNFCDAPIIADTKTQTLQVNSSYYYIGHFSKYIKTDAQRIEIAVSKATTLQHVAFINPDGTIVLIVMNETDGTTDFTAELDDKSISYSMPPHSIATLLWSR
jgi:glucosylceramidase